MRHTFLSDEWFARLDAAVASATDLQIPPAMRAVEINITITGPAGDTRVHVKHGVLHRGHRDGAPTAIVLSAALARKVFVDADAAAGVQAFLAGEMTATGDLARLVAMQMEEPTPSQRRLAAEVAGFTA